MTWDALLSILLAVVVPGLMALIGGVLAAKALPVEDGKSNRQMWFYVCVFVFLFLVSVGLAFVQQIRLTAQQEAVEKKTAQDKLQSTGDMKFVQGQLDTMNRVLAMVAANSSPKQMAVLFRGVSTTEKSTLKKRTLALCAEIEAWLNKYPKPPSVAIPGRPTPQEQTDQNAYFQQTLYSVIFIAPSFWMPFPRVALYLRRAFAQRAFCARLIFLRAAADIV